MTDSTSAVELADSVSEFLYALTGWILLVLGVFVLFQTGVNVATDPTMSSVVSAIGGVIVSLLFVLFGVFVNPRFRRRLDRRHSITTFGYTETVDDDIFQESAGETCTECLERVDQGRIRRYRSEFVVAGLPVYTRSVGLNHYCPECGTEHIPDHDAGRDRAVDEEQSTATTSVERN